MIIFLRGLPGTGKTVISNILAERLHRNVVHVDDFKRDFMKSHPEADFLKEVVPQSYAKTLEKMAEYIDRDLIVEEIFRNADFVRNVLDFTSKNSIKTFWFKIVRDEKLLLEVDTARERKIKNSKEDLIRMEQQIASIVIEGETVIDNQDIEKSVDTILNSIA